MKVIKRISNGFYLFVTLWFIVLWTYAARSKWNDYANFRFELGRSPYILHWADLVAVMLPIGEIIMAILLVLGFAFRKIQLLGLYLSFFTMSLFTGYIYMMLNYSYYVSCSCGGILDKMTWEDHLLFNIVVTAAAFLAILIQQPTASPKATLSTDFSPKSQYV